VGRAVAIHVRRQGGAPHEFIAAVARAPRSAAWFAPCLGRAPVSILLLHHDQREASALGSALEQAGYEVHSARAGEDAQAFDPEAFDVVTLGLDGSRELRAATCRGLRARGYLGGIVASSTDAAEVRELLDAGADELVVAPFDAWEVEIRVGVALRRAVTRARMRWGPFELDRVHRSVRLRGVPITLTAREYALLVCLLEAAGEPVARADLLLCIWGRDEEPGSNLVQVHLSRLRDKLGADAPLIETVRGSGYRLRS